jgi:hypothetical protein
VQENHAPTMDLLQKITANAAIPKHPELSPAQSYHLALSILRLGEFTSLCGIELHLISSTLVAFQEAFFMLASCLGSVLPPRELQGLCQNHGSCWGCLWPPLQSRPRVLLDPNNLDFLGLPFLLLALNYFGFWIWNVNALETPSVTDLYPTGEVTLSWDVVCRYAAVRYKRVRGSDRKYDQIFVITRKIFRILFWVASGCLICAFWMSWGIAWFAQWIARFEA